MINNLQWNSSQYIYIYNIYIVLVYCHAYLQGLSRICVQSVIWKPKTLFFDSLDTQKFMSGLAKNDFSMRIKDAEDVVSLL